MDNENIYLDPELDLLDEEDEDIDWIGLVAKVWKGKTFIIVCTVIFTIIGVAVALNTPRQYTSTVSIAPEAASAAGPSSSISNMVNMLGLGDIANSNGVDALNVSLFPDMAASTPFLTNLFDVKVKPHTSKDEIKDGQAEKQETTLYRWMLKKDEPKGVVGQMLESIFGKKNVKKDDDIPLNTKHLTDEQDRVVNELKRAITIDLDKQTNITSISITLEDPLIAAQIADTVCQHLQAYIYNYRTQKAAGDLEYYTKLAAEAKEKMIKAQTAYAISIDFDRSVILETVSSEKERLEQEAELAGQLYAQMEQQVELAKAKYQEAKPVFAIIEPATVPLQPSGAGRTQIVLVFMLIGFAGSVVWKLFINELIHKFLANMKEKLNENENTTNN